MSNFGRWVLLVIQPFSTPVLYDFRPQRGHAALNARFAPAKLARDLKLRAADRNRARDSLQVFVRDESALHGRKCTRGPGGK